MNEKKVIIITPSYRVKNLRKILKTIKFNEIFKWIIIYDGSKISENFKQFEKFEKIIELTYKSKDNEIRSAQRNKGLDYIKENFPGENLFIYFLDDDNIIHPNFYDIIKTLKINHFYTFDQQRNRYVLSGENPKVYYIDMGMFLFDFKLVSNIRFRLDVFNGEDGIYIEECCKTDLKKHIYVPNVYSYYNYLKRNIFRRSYYRFFWFIRHFLSNNFKLFIIVKRKKP